MWRRPLLIGTIGAFVGLVVLPFNPVNSKLLKIPLLMCVAGSWVGCVMLAWKRKPVRIGLLIVAVLAALPFILPGRAIKADEVRAGYLQRMAGFEGTKYHWGGESSRGIDCSGLPRRAFRDSLLGYGIRHANARAIRGYLEQWWYDASAQALSEGYRNYTSPVGIEGTIREMEYGDLEAGDLAVTMGGIHLLAYVGDGRWIQADPGVGAVVTLDGRKDDNSWFRAPVTVHRWRLFAEP